MQFQIDPTVLRIIEVAVLAVFFFIIYLYALSKVRAYARENDIPLQKARSLENTAKIILFILFIFIALHIGGAITNLALSTSIVGAVLILVSQSFMSNFVSGLYIVVSRPFNYGDRIEVREYTGDVQDIGLISTKLKTPNNEIITIPNSILLNNEIRNYDILGSEVVVEFEDIGISYNSDVQKAKEIILNVIKKYAKENPHLLQEPEPRVGTGKFGDSAILLKVKFYVDDIRIRGAVSSDIRERIKSAFDANGIEIPFPQRVVYMKK
ncbi:MAG: mechanosensitive ion channel family protein [Candidatus Hydrothermarchaeota archaeon]|nr:mechanosensitive ion channel family protein [Candidatus Hydrothermarchaeota archaeon]